MEPSGGAVARDFFLGSEAYGGQAGFWVPSFGYASRQGRDVREGETFWMLEYCL